jgi:hypothetical protein
VSEWHKGFKKGRESLQGDERKTVLQLPEQKNQRKSFKSVFEDRTLSVRMLEKMTGINRETVREILVEDLRKKKYVLLLFLIC